MKVLFLSSMALFRETRFGGAKRLYYFARELERRAELSLVCLDGCREWPGGEASGEFRRALYLPLGGRKSAWRRAASLPVEIAEEIDRHAPAVASFLGAGRFDSTLLAFPLSLSFLGRPWQAAFGKRVYLEDDLLLETYRREASGSGGPWARAKARLRRAQAESYFRRKLEGAGGWICISEEEREVVRGLFPGLPAYVLKYGLPMDEYPLLPPGDPAALGFIGNFRHAPNLDAALWLARDLFPRVVEALPEARLVIAGRGAPAALAEACRRHGAVRLLEDVPDLAGFYRSIGLFVNPIRSGRGLRTKVVEAAAYGRPVVSTDLGAEGLEELHLPRWDAAAGLVRCVRALQDPGVYRDASSGNRRAVEAAFSMDRLGGDLLGLLRP